MENRNIIRSAFTVGGFTLLSRILGLVREIFMAKFFGTTLAMSAFVVAFRIPNLFRALFGEGALSAAFIPEFLRARRQEGEAAGWRLARRVTTLVGAFLLAVTAVGIAGMGLAMLRPGWVGEKWSSVLPLAQVMLPYVFFICMAGLGMGVLNSYRKFSVSAFTPALLNIAMILSLTCIVPFVEGGADRRIAVVAWTVLAAGAIQLAYQLPALWSCGWRPEAEFRWRDERVQRVFILMGPSALGLAVNQVNVMLSSWLALKAGTWAPSALYYSERLIYLPQGLLATSLGAVLLAILSDYAAQGLWDDVKDAVEHGLRTLLFVMTPAAIGLCVLAEPIVRVVLERDAFDATSTFLTARALRFYAPGLMAFCLAKVFVPAFYARQDTKTPIKIGVCSVTLCCMMNVLSIWLLPTYWKHAGLALSTVLAECFNGTMLAMALQRRMGRFAWRGVVGGWLRALAASAVMGAAAWGVERAVSPWLYVRMDLQLARIAGVAAALGTGVVVYFAIARLFRYPELGFVMEALRRKRAAKKPAPSAPAA